jgi:nucleotidyltransferase substrate binding protein (TIGR01987 family)
MNIEPLEKAYLSLEEAIELYDGCDQSPQVALALRDAVIQRFEYTYELAWKMLQRWIQENSTAVNGEPFTRKELYRIAARFGLIDEPADWFVYHKARNLASHTYDESNAAEAFKAARNFAADVRELVGRLRVKG